MEFMSLGTAMQASNVERSPDCNVSEMRGFSAVCRGYLECQPSLLVPPKTSASLLTAKAIAGEVKGSCATLGELSKYERVRHIFSLSQLLDIEIVWKPWPGPVACCWHCKCQ